MEKSKTLGTIGIIFSIVAIIWYALPTFMNEWDFVEFLMSLSVSGRYAIDIILAVIACALSAFAFIKYKSTFTIICIILAIIALIWCIRDIVWINSLKGAAEDAIDALKNFSF